jgi:hypothetical protein
MSALLAYAIVVKFWLYLLLGFLGYLAYRYIKWDKARKAYHDEIPF